MAYRLPIRRSSIILKDKYDYVKIDDLDHYYPDFPELVGLLKSYVDSLDNVPFLFPSGAFKSIRYLSKLSRGRLLLIAGDQGTSTEEMLKHKSKPYLSLHGSFSMPINYHAIARYFHLSGGLSLLTTYADPVLVVSASALGGKLEEFPKRTWPLQPISTILTQTTISSFWNTLKRSG